MNILVTGADGFIGSNLIELLSNNTKFNFFKGLRPTLDLYSADSIEKYIDENQIEAVIHCAIEGGSRLKQDTYEMFYRNIVMYENLIKFSCRYKTFINFASGAEFDRRFDISNVNEYNLINSTPTDFYGLSKNIISKRLLNYSIGVNLRIFGCFYHNELETRFIKNNINNYINNKPITIYQDKYMDFFYMKDLASVVEYFLSTPPSTYKDINMSYSKKYKLSDVAKIINNLSSYKVDVQYINNKEPGLNYTGNGSLLTSLDLILKGIEIGIKECYNKSIQTIN